jgi:hypothetical protein
MSAERFAFVANPRPVVQGGIVGVLLLASFYGWGAWTGRAHYDLTSALILIGSVLVTVPWVLFRIRRQSVRAAAELGFLELDDRGLRWERPDATLGFSAAWSEFSRASVDARNFAVVLFRPDGAPQLLGVLSENGGLSGFVILERFDALVARVKEKLPTEPHRIADDPSAARRTRSARSSMGSGSCC